MGISFSEAATDTTASSCHERTDRAQLCNLDRELVKQGCKIERLRMNADGHKMPERPCDGVSFRNLPFLNLLMPMFVFLA
jgi:hypothetical protein